MKARSYDRLAVGVKKVKPVTEIGVQDNRCSLPVFRQAAQAVGATKTGTRMDTAVDLIPLLMEHGCIYLYSISEYLFLH